MKRRINLNNNKIYHCLIPVLLVYFFNCCKSAETTPAPISHSNTKLEVLSDEMSVTDSPSKILSFLKNGYERYCNGQFRHIHIKRINSNELVEHVPVVAILTCSELSIPPEILLDADNRNLVVISNEANLADKDATSQLEMLVKEKHIKLIMVIGHSNCQLSTQSTKEKLGKTAQEGAGNQLKQARKNTGDQENNRLYFEVNKLRTNNLFDTLIKNKKLIILGALYNDSSRNLQFETLE